MSTSSKSEQRADYKAGSTILKTPEQSGEYQGRQNHVSNVVLHGIPIVSLRIDGKERLCLAQISNTLLKQFSYNEIHNRRVALGITCVQCTPVQLEILRRAGAMPISSRRCGMITKREAERLVKSFLEDNRPPKLPDNFYFEVNHQCGWGCKGKFEPSRYNSSRAKCIRCNFCNLYFSPNKFIFHFHRTSDSKYNHPDAANFNSWRRHLHLCPGSDTDEISYAWEDVKAMFNGGSRKRMVSSPGFPEEHSPPSIPEPKRPKPSADEDMISKPSFSNQYPNFPLFSMPGSGKGYPFNPITTANPLAFHYQLGKADYADDSKAAHAIAYNPWRQTTDFVLPPYDLLWASQFNTRAGTSFTGYRPHFVNTSPVKDLTTADNCLRQSPSETHTSSEDESSSFTVSNDVAKSANHRPSAFRPIGKSLHSEHTGSLGKEIGHCIKSFDNSDNKEKADETEDLDVDVEDAADECADNQDGFDASSSIVDEQDDREKIVYSPDTSGHAVNADSHTPDSKRDTADTYDTTVHAERHDPEKVGSLCKTEQPPVMLDFITKTKKRYQHR